MSRPRCTDWRRKIVALIVSIVLTLCALEIGVRLYGYDLNLSRVWKYHPVYGWVIDENGRIDNVNSYGFRYAELDRAKPRGTRRAVLLGDSFSQASAFSFVDSFPGLLEKALNDESPWQVINLGVGDWGTAQQLLALRSYGLEFQPDVVIIQVFPFNDLANNTIGLAHTASYQDYHRPYFVHRNGSLKLAYVNGCCTILRRSQLFGIVENALSPAAAIARQGPGNLQLIRRRRNDFFRENATAKGLDFTGALYSLVRYEHLPEQVREGWKVSEFMFREIRATVPDDVPIIGVVIPYVHTFEPSWTRFSKRLGSQASPSHGTCRTEKILEDSGIHVISMRSKILASGMSPDDYFLANDSHLSAFGHQNVASWILQTMSLEGLTSAMLNGELVSVDLLAKESPHGVIIGGMTNIRENDGIRLRYGLGPETTIAYHASQESETKLVYTLANSIKNQQIKVDVNGTTQSEIELGDRGREFSDLIRFSSRKGRNEIRFQYSDWNHKRTTYYPRVRLKVATMFLKFAIEHSE